MRPVSRLSQPAPTAPLEEQMKWAVMMIGRLCDASQEDTGAIADPFTVTNVIVNRSLNPSTATLAQVAQVLGTLIQDQKKRGMNRAAG